MTKYVAGIDFGTTNSAAAISDGNAPRMVDVEGGKDTIPTALFFEDKTQMEVAKDLGISQVQVSRLEKKILLRVTHRINIQMAMVLGVLCAA